MLELKTGATVMFTQLKSRNKGARNETAITNMLKDAGIEAERVPLSGAGGTFAGDILIRGRRYEAKIRCDGFREYTSGLTATRALSSRR